MMLALEIASSVLLFIVLLLLYRNERSRQRSKEELKDQQEDIRIKNEQIEASLQEKEVMLKEIHHRVKNNLQLVSSLLQLQSTKFDDPEVLKALEEGQGRVQSMAMIHQMLYENEDLSRINLDDYLQNLWQSVSQSFGELSPNIEVEQTRSNLVVEVDTAVPVGLIANELFYNCFKYAFDGKKAGKVKMGLSPDTDDNYRFDVIDNGNGLPPDFDERKKKSLGMRLVDMLSRQLDGSVEYIPEESGTHVKVIFSTNWKE